MKIKDIIKDIKGVFKLPIKKYYLGKIIHYTPYFEPIRFNSDILFIRKLELKSEKELNDYKEKYPHLKDKKESKFSNLPIVRRNKNWTFKIFNNWYHIQLGYPFAIVFRDLGWKDKFESPRFEWPPSFQVWFFKWQFCIHWIAPNGDNDSYWEQVLWYLKYSDKDINKTIKTWGWVDHNTKLSTWKDQYLDSQYLAQY